MKKTFWIPDKDQHVFSVERAKRRLTDNEEQKCMFTLSFPVDLDDNKIPTLIEFNSMRTFLTYNNPNVIYSLFYADSDYSSVEEVIVEWVDQDANLHNSYGPAHVNIGDDDDHHIRYFANKRETNRHYLKHQYEVTHLDVVDDDHFHKGGKAMLLADLADNKPFWKNWIKNFEEERHIMAVIMPALIKH